MTTTDQARNSGADARAAYIRRLVDQAPPLSADQRDRLAVLLRPVRRAAERKAAA